MRKLLFPPIAPTSLPAFDKAGVLKYYFKPSIANSIEQTKHLQMTIVRLDTNRSILNSNTYPFDILFKNSAEIFEDKEKGFWYVEVPASLFPASDVPYKIQIRLGETDISGMSEKDLGTVLKDLDKMSEWSIVTTVMPITIPDFGIQSFDEKIENRVSSTGQVFSGYYEPQDAKRQETLSSFRYNLYSGDPDDKSTWKLLSTSGEKYIGSSDKVNMTHTFTYELKEKSRFIVTMTVKSKNLYTSTKIYKIYSASYPLLEMFNSIDVVTNEHEAKMEVTIRGKQILLRGVSGANVKYFKDEPGNQAEPGLTATHAKITGVVESKNNFSLSEKNGVWICQFKAMFPNIKSSLKEISENPTIALIQSSTLPSDSNYYVRIKIGCMKVDLAYPTSNNLNPSPEWEYRFVIRKEVVSKQNGIETIMLEQNRIIKSTEVVNPKQEYYFYIKEQNGGIDVSLAKTYISTNSEI